MVQKYKIEDVAQKLGYKYNTIMIYLMLFTQFVLKTLLDKYYYKREKKYFEYDYILYNFLLTGFIWFSITALSKYTLHGLLSFFEVFPENPYTIAISILLLILFVLFLFSQRGFITYLFNYFMYGDKMSESIELPTFITLDSILIFIGLSYDVFNHFYWLSSYIYYNHRTYFDKLLAQKLFDE